MIGHTGRRHNQSKEDRFLDKIVPRLGIVLLAEMEKRRHPRSGDRFAISSVKPGCESLFIRFLG